MTFQIILNVLFLSLFLITLFTMVESFTWSCSKNESFNPFIPSQVKGVWYEIARIPSSKVPACVKVIAPESQLNGDYILKLDYINNVNNGWKPTEESLVFPWSEAQNGYFKLVYGNADVNVTINFKYMGSIDNYTLVCGYSDFAPKIPLIHILSRNREVDSTVKEEIDSLANNFNINLSEVTWVQQDGRCNGTENLSKFSIGVLLSFYLFQRILKKNVLLT